jgi:hypothetical protein
MPPIESKARSFLFFLKDSGLADRILRDCVGKLFCGDEQTGFADCGNVLKPCTKGAIPHNTVAKRRIADLVEQYSKPLIARQTYG